MQRNDDLALDFTKFERLQKKIGESKSVLKSSMELEKDGLTNFR